MKTVYLVRHAKSSWADMSLRDIDRPLNKRGFRDAPFMAKMLKGKGARPDALVSSPANRAFTTASYFAKAIDWSPEDIVVEKDIYEAYVSDLFEIVRSLSEEWDTICLFGHNPTFTSFANRFGGRDYIPNIPTCGIVRIESDCKQWSDFSEENSRLVEFHYPKQYFK